MDSGYDIKEVLDHLDPALLDYKDWLSVGMALQHEGYDVGLWDEWSQRDQGRYHRGECRRKWNGFGGGGETPVTAGTIVQLAREQGYYAELGHELDWEDEIQKDDYVVVDRNWIEGKEIEEPEDWKPEEDLIKYLDTLFEAGDNVGYVTESWKREDEKGIKWLPQKGHWDRTAGQLIELLGNCGGDIGKVFGDYNPEVGAWIRFNPLDGNGCKDQNVIRYRHALVESDSLDIGKQNAIMRELQLPIACLVYSGGKSLHAIVKIDAGDYNEYRKRVDYLYAICRKNGLKIDRQNCNPSRLSRMPGVIRNGHKQFLVDTNIGKSNWQEWQDWIEAVNDDLPDPESLGSVWDDLPELSPCLIDGILRQGHKMLIAGPSKAGKSFLQIELCISIAEGRPWLGRSCTQGRILYVNLELDRASCLHRFRDVYEALGWPAENLQNIDIWNLRGRSVPMDKLAPKLIRRAQKKNYIAVVIDPIYKVITGDENSADQMAKFCNQFDRVCTELGCAVIYCHHHSKGAQGGKRAMDRASGSGVFARDPDALLDLIGLDITETLLEQEKNKAVCACCAQYLDKHAAGGWRDDVSQDDILSRYQLMGYCRSKLDRWKMQTLNRLVKEAEEHVKALTAWRIEGTLREFPKFEPVNLWFEYPVHRMDESGALGDIQPDMDTSPWLKGKESRRKNAEDAKIKRISNFNINFDGLSGAEGNDFVSAEELAERMDVSSKTLLGWFGTGNKGIPGLKKEYVKFMGDDGLMYIKRKGATDAT